MKKKQIAKSLAAGIQLLILIAAPLLSRSQTPGPQIVQPSADSATPRDIYADAFAGLTYSDKQKESISKIQQDVASRKAAVLKDDKLTGDLKDAMLGGYTRIEYSLIYKELTPEQKKQVSRRMHELRASEQPAQKTQAR